MSDTKPPCLTVLGGPMAGNRFVLQDGVANILIGSDPVCAFHLPLPGVSAMHARLAVEPSGVSIWEAGSARGLHVNDSRVEGSTVLRNGDIIWLGTPGDDDVVMLQCILPRLPSLTVPAAGAAADASGQHTPHAEEQDDADVSVVEEAEEAPSETVALDPRSFSIGPESAPPSPEAGEEEPPTTVHETSDPDLSEPMALVVDSPLDAHFAAVSAGREPEEAGLVVDAESESFVKMPSEPLGGGLSAAQEFELADEGMPLTVQEPASSFTLPPAPIPPPPVIPAAPPMETVSMPPGFEDETEERLVEAATIITGPAYDDPHEVDQEAYRAAYDLTMPPTPAPPAAPPPTRVTPAVPPTPSPAATRPMATPAPASAPRPARPIAPTPARKPAGPSVSQRTVAADKSIPPAAPPAKSSSAGLYAGLGIGALLVLGGGAFVVMKMLGGKSPTVAQSTPPPVLPSAAPTQAPVATPPPVATPTPEPATPPPVATPVPAPTPTGKPTPSPSPTKPGATPSPAKPTPSPSPTKPGATPTPVVATPAGPSAEQAKAQQLASLLSQGEAAMGAQKYDQAVGFYDEALKLDPGNAKASAEKAAATAARDSARRRFVPGRTVVTTEKAAGGNISGFEGAAVQKAPDFLGRIEFEMSPAAGLKAGDPWTLKIFVVNEGKKPIRITDLAATATANGERTGGAAGARAKEVAPQVRVQVGEMSGAWKEGTQSWSAEVLLTAKGDSLKNTLTWK